MTLITSDVVGSVKLTCHSFTLTKLPLHELMSHFSRPLQEFVSAQSVAFRKLGIAAVVSSSVLLSFLLQAAFVLVISIPLLLYMNFVTGMTI